MTLFRQYLRIDTVHPKPDYGEEGTGGSGGRWRRHGWRHSSVPSTSLWCGLWTLLPGSLGQGCDEPGVGERGCALSLLVPLIWGRCRDFRPPVARQTHGPASPFRAALGLGQTFVSPLRTSLSHQYFPPRTEAHGDVFLRTRRAPLLDFAFPNSLPSSFCRPQMQPSSFWSASAPTWAWPARKWR